MLITTQSPFIYESHDYGGRSLTKGLKKTELHFERFNAPTSIIPRAEGYAGLEPLWVFDSAIDLHNHDIQ